MTERHYKAHPQQGDIWRHHTGGAYRIEAVATHTETAESLVIYRRLYDHVFRARPLAMFMGALDENGDRPRFRRIYSHDCGMTDIA